MNLERGGVRVSITDHKQALDRFPMGKVSKRANGGES
jgi:hypothetical protein